MQPFACAPSCYPAPQAVTTPSRDLGGLTALAHALSHVIRHLSCYIGLLYTLKMFE